MGIKPQSVGNPPVANSPSEEEVSTQVGYKRPPINTQFKKGHSGNPKGRRKGSKNTGALLVKVLGISRYRLTAKSNGCPRRTLSLRRK